MSMHTKIKKILITLAIVIPCLTSCLLAGNLYYITGLPQTVVAQGQPKPDRNKLRTGVVMNINKYRKEAGLAPLTPTIMLSQSASLKASKLIDRGMFEHGDIKDEFTILGVWDHGCVQVGENLSENYWPADRITTAWFESPKHKEIMLMPQYNYVGVGIGQDDDTYMVVAHFASCTTRVY